MLIDYNPLNRSVYKNQLSALSIMQLSELLKFLWSNCPVLMLVFEIFRVFLLAVLHFDTRAMNVA
jgi:hypothetical protein